MQKLYESSMKELIKKLAGKRLLGFYHKTLAVLANVIYGRPSEKLIVIGVTGTNGKSTTVNLIAKILEDAGYKAAFTSTVNFKVGQEERLNDLKMTMPGRFFLQKFLKQATKAGCSYAIIESSSEGVLQYRHVGIHYDVMVFTNLTPEHLETHGGFEKYKQAKLTYFRQLAHLPHKILNNQKVKKIIVVNADDPYSGEFSNFAVDQIISFGGNLRAQIRAENFSLSELGSSFLLNGIKFNLKLPGLFNIYNALASIAVASGLGISLETSKRALENVSGIPGRMELIEEGQPFKVLVDYAPEVESLKQMYETVKGWSHPKIIHVLGSTGGGRDKSRRAVLGQIAAANADIVIVTNEDPYNDDPQKIIDDVASGVAQALKILDRREAIAKALSLASHNDLVIITGKGAEQKMAVKGGYIPWDDRVVARQELRKLTMTMTK